VTTDGSGSPRGGLADDGEPVPQRDRKRRPLWQEVLVVVVAALGVAMLVKTLLLQAFYIPSESMEPGLVRNDRILVEKVSYELGGSPERGDVVVFKDPGDWLPPEDAAGPTGAVPRLMERIGLYPSGGHLVKRVIGVAGDVIHCCDDQGRIEVNGVALDEKDYAREDGAACYGPMRSCRWTTTRVPAGTIFVMGDNRNHSADSSFHICDGQGCTPGDEFVPVDLVVGKVFVLMWPFGHFSWLHRPDTFAAVPAPGGGG
jgi:signal peptidase I